MSDPWTAWVGAGVFLAVFAVSRQEATGSYHFLSPYSHGLTVGLVAGLAAIELAQRFLTELDARRNGSHTWVSSEGASRQGDPDQRHAFAWRDAMDTLVRWRQIGEPNDQVWRTVLCNWSPTDNISELLDVCGSVQHCEHIQH